MGYWAGLWAQRQRSNVSLGEYDTGAGKWFKITHTGTGVLYYMGISAEDSDVTIEPMIDNKSIFGIYYTAGGSTVYQPTFANLSSGNMGVTSSSIPYKLAKYNAGGICRFDYFIPNGLKFTDNVYIKGTNNAGASRWIYLTLITEGDFIVITQSNN